MNTPTTGARLLTKQDVAERIGFHPEHVMRLARTGKFPRPIKLGATARSSVRFVPEEVDAWVAERMSARGIANDQAAPT